MSNMQDHSFDDAHDNQMDPHATASSSETISQKTKVQSLAEELEALESSIDKQSYSVGEVPQVHQLDPEAHLPLNSDPLISSENVVELLLDEVNILIQEEIGQIQKLQKSIDFWEERIEKNKLLIERNNEQIKQNNTEIIYDKKNRDYWWGRSEQVILDFQNAQSASRQNNWSWLIKKYGLKNADGTPIDSDHPCIEELSDGGTSNLSGEYRTSGNKYEQAKKDKEAINNRLIRENSKYMATNETLQRYIQSTYLNKIEPLQDGVLLLKELTNKLKAFASQGSNPKYGDMREWAELFINEFLKDNPRVPQHVVTDFRRIASIPLPAENS